jgi:hypothetical protein
MLARQKSLRLFGHVLLPRRSLLARGAHPLHHFTHALLAELALLTPSKRLRCRVLSVRHRHELHLQEDRRQQAEETQFHNIIAYDAWLRRARNT